MDIADLCNELFQLGRSSHRLAGGEGVHMVAVLQQRRRAGPIGIAHTQLEHETVQLGCGQHLRTRRTHRVFRCQHDKGLRQGPGHAVHGDLQLLHSLQQSGLGLAGGTVDLVRQQQIGHNGSGLIFQLAVCLIEYGETDNIRGQGIGSELDTLGVQTQGLGKRLGQGRLAHAGHILQQHMALGQDGQQHLADDVLLAQNDLVDLCLNLICQLVHAFFLFLPMM